MPHVEIAAILLAGPTLKLFNNQGENSINCTCLSDNNCLEYVVK